MLRRNFLKGAAQLPLILPALYSRFSSALNKSSTAEFRLAFGSCCLSHQPQPIWYEIAKTQPNVFVSLGDNYYADPETLEGLKMRFEEMDRHPDYNWFRDRFPVIGTWDDHDYGYNDAGNENPLKHQSKEFFLKFFREPANSPRRTRAGVYHSYYFGSAPSRVQVILLDMRWFRSQPAPDRFPTTYLPNYSPDATLLGEEQWAWLERELQKPADIRLLGSSVQFCANHRAEKWGNFPLEKQRFINLIDRYSIGNLVVLSGDVHYAELSREVTPLGRDLYDFTSSGLNRTGTSQYSRNDHRLIVKDNVSNFGLVTIRDGLITVEAKDVSGRTLFARQIQPQKT